MARAATTTDAFTAVAEKHRRDLLEVLAEGEASVTELVERLGLAQPQVSKHLAVLLAVDLVHVRADGRHRLYRLNGPALQAVHDWIKPFEAHWNAKLDRLDTLLHDLRQGEQP